MPESDGIDLVFSLVGHPDETEWIEFKEGSSDPERIARDISALANAAAYCGRAFAYKLWGVEDTSHRLVGTSFDPYAARVKGSQGLPIWLKQVLSSNAVYEFVPLSYDGKRFVVLKVSAATGEPVCFNGNAYIREGSSTTPLRIDSAKSAELWRRLQRTEFSVLDAKTGLDIREVAELLNVSLYFEHIGQRQPSSNEVIVAPFTEQGFIRIQDDGRFAITNLGALLLARHLSSFSSLRRRILRVVRYAGKGAFDVLDDTSFDEGYASALEHAEKHIMTLIPAQEVVDGAFRRVRHAFPQVAIRELLANTVVHQDLSDTTSGPLVTIREGRIDFANPGAPLIPPDRFLNALPKTRNSDLVRIMREMDLCEEGGTGWDRVVAACESQLLPAPKIEISTISGTRVTLLGERAFSRMTKVERRDALYWHSCLLYEQGDSMSNQSARERLGLGDERKDVVATSRLIRECCELGLIKGEDEEASDRFRRYIPAWA